MARMKILVAYDGSACADAAIRDLRRAGLPRQAETTVLSVGDVFLPARGPVSQKGLPVHIAKLVDKERKLAEKRVEEAHRLAKRAAHALKRDFGAWKIRAVAVGDTPVWAIIKKAEEMKPGLVVVGSHGRTGFKELWLGSVSHKLLNELPFNVRIGRSGKTAGRASKLFVALDHSAHSRVLIDRVLSRRWPKGTKVCLFTALDSKLVAAVGAGIYAGDTAWRQHAEDRHLRAWATALLRRIGEKFRAQDLDVSVKVKEGDPDETILAESKRWGADCIFIGARGSGMRRRFALGTVSTAVATKAGVSVEVVHD